MRRKSGQDPAGEGGEQIRGRQRSRRPRQVQVEGDVVQAGEEHVVVVATSNQGGGGGPEIGLRGTRRAGSLVGHVALVLVVRRCCVAVCAEGHPQDDAL